MKSHFSLAPEMQVARVLPRQGLQLLMSQCPHAILQVTCRAGE